MATGLAVDYSVYIAVKFSATPGVSRNERVAKSMQNTGAAVALGGITALIGTLPLAGASSTVRTSRHLKKLMQTEYKSEKLTQWRRDDI